MEKPSGLYKCRKCGYMFYSKAKKPDCSKCRTTNLRLIANISPEKIEQLQKKLKEKRLLRKNTTQKTKRWISFDEWERQNSRENNFTSMQELLRRIKKK
jgi:Fe-S-cluster-containing dehydrogenase component